MVGGGERWCGGRWEEAVRDGSELVVELLADLITTLEVLELLSRSANNSRSSRVVINVC